MSQFQQFEDSHTEEEKEAARGLLLLRQAEVLVSPNHHRQQESGCRFQKPVHGTSGCKVSGQATEMNNDKTPDSDEALSDITLDHEYLTPRGTTPVKRADHDPDKKFSDIKSEDEYFTAIETTPSESVDHDSDAAISDSELEDNISHLRGSRCGCPTRSS
ncbi:hypothetical protein MMC31_001850 [Peltigera leucophlebia]|nr:hypothetical protein [Peltigera leucophlebia]